ncbi:MAG: FAD:protein FMN transferase [Proteobacteria bacterium]|nr:FAD:protein FMN transferase [Pseudomonadota bacterium]
MGTEYLVKIADQDADPQRQAIVNRIDSLLLDINQAMSTYIEDSELSLINRNSGSDWISVSDGLWAVLTEARRISELSQGAFDITVGPLVNLWGFGPRVYTQATLPQDELITAALKNTGYRQIDFQENDKSIRKQNPGLYIDLSAIAKGYAVDQIAGLLNTMNFGNYMVEIGGEVRTRGRRSDDRGWRVGIEKPLSDRRAVHKILQLENMAMATSGDYRNFREIDGKRYSHTIDPATGYPVTHRLASVTVLHESAMSADALATAFSVMGPETGMHLAEDRDIAALFIVRSETGYSETSTHDFENYLVEETRQ